MADQSVDEIWRLIKRTPIAEVSNMGHMERITAITYPMPNGGTVERRCPGNTEIYTTWANGFPSWPMRE